MAITVNQSAQSPALGYNKILYTLDSTNNTQPNFKYVADVYVNNSPDYVRIKKPAHPTNGYAAFDLQGVIQDYFNVDSWAPGSSGVVTCPNSIVEYDVRWGEEYGPASGVVTYQNLSSSLNKYAISAALDEFTIDAGRNNPLFNYYQYDSNNINGGAQMIFLTAGDRFRIGENDDFVLDFYQDNTAETYFVDIQTFDANGSVIDTYTYKNDQYPSNTRAKKRCRAYVGTRNLNAAYLSVGSQPVIDSSVYSYKIRISDSTLTYVSDPITFIIDRQCTKVDYLRLTWLNQWGGYDTINCYGGFQEMYNYKRSMFKKSNYVWAGTSYDFNPTVRTNTQFNNDIEYSIKVWSGWVTEGESAWIEGLFRSKDVMVVDTTNNTLVPVNLKTDSYTKKTHARDGLFNYDFEVMPSFNSKVQKW
jgi:hypothetical protein